MEQETVEKYLDYYGETQGVLPEKIREYHEKHVKQGLGKQDLYELAYESSTRSAHHVRENSEELCREVIDNVEKVNGDFSKIALISSLKGFKAPTASVILTVIDPENHAIVDTRVWASLERFGRVKGRKETFDAADYRKMMEEIRDISEETGFTPEEIGYALFAYDVDKREGTLH